MSISNTSSKRIGPLIVAGLILFGGVASLIAQVAFHHAPADPEDWNRAAELAVELSEPTDAIRTHPSWSEAPLSHLRAVGNLLHRHHHPLLEDFYQVERVLILTESRRQQEALERLPFTAQPSDIHSFDSVDLLVIPVPVEMQIQSDLIALLPYASVHYTHTESEESESCRWSGRENSWRCEGRGRGSVVGPILLELDDDPRRCLQAFPPSDDRLLSLEVRIPDASNILRVRAGLDLRAARIAKGDDVIYRIFLDDEKVEETRVDAQNSSWTPSDFDMSPREGEAVDLRIEVESVTNPPHHRRFCVNAWPLTSEQAQRSNR